MTTHKTVTPAQYKALLDWMKNELIDNPNYEQHCEVNRPKLLKEAVRVYRLKRTWSEFLPLKAMSEKDALVVLNLVVVDAATWHDNVDPR